jgi:hypothetical protein
MIYDLSVFRMAEVSPTVTIDQYWLTFLIAVVLPAAVALVTSRLASGGVKAIVLIFLSALNGWLTSLMATDGTFELKAAVIGFFVSFITAVASHFGLLNSSVLGITGKDGIIQRNVPVGIG